MAFSKIDKAKVYRSFPWRSPNRFRVTTFCRSSSLKNSVGLRSKFAVTGQEVFNEALVSSGPLHETARKAFWEAAYPESTPEEREGESICGQSKLIVEAATRDLLVDLCVQTESSESAILTPKSKRLLTMVLWLAEKELVDAGLPYILIEDLVDVCETAAEIQELFSWIEEKQQSITSSSTFQQGKPSLLRACDNALDKIQGLENAALSGKILLQIAKMWGAEGSAVNRGAFMHADLKIDISIDEAGSALYDLQGVPINREYYVKFWRLLQRFRDSSGSSTASTLNNIKLVISFVDMHPVKSKSISSGLGIGREQSLLYNTDPRVFRLQLSDASFRCHFLVECLLYIHSVESGSNVKSGREKRGRKIALDFESVRSKVNESLHSLGDAGKITAKCMVRHLRSRPGPSSTKRRRKDEFCKEEKNSDANGGPSEPIRTQQTQDGENGGAANCSNKKRRKLNESLEIGRWQGRERGKKRFEMNDNYVPTLEGVCGIVDDIDSKEFCSHLSDDLGGESLDPKKNTEYCWRVYRQLSSDSHLKVNFDESLDIGQFVKSAFPSTNGAATSGGNHGVKTEEPNQS
ncbi:hypothetical protein BSKO_03118 [Bryopsis sp. KO-2023]|nr:hypothetical protein BSKO_03118 [Bryopsis sp. KO-2023]